jgi:hypothetical protein
LYKIFFNTEASFEMQEAYDWYESQQIGLGENLFNALDYYFDIISNNPLHYQFFYKKKRAVYIKDFPYQIIYSVYDNKILIYSVFHTKRNPKIWKKR